MSNSDEKICDYVSDLDEQNYNIALNAINKIILFNFNSHKKLLLQYDNKIKCPYTGYFLKTIFEGPVDDPDFKINKKYKSAKILIEEIAKENNFKYSYKNDKNFVIYFVL
jgi:hypothetical protein